jgi:hypothetical protein
MSLRELRRQFPLRERRPLLVTEVTRMSQAVCVACYDLHAGSICRPLPRNITNLPNVEYTSGRITVGTVLGVVPADPQPVSAYPHASEDLCLTDNPTSLAVLTPGQVVEALRPTADRTVSAIFDGNLLERKYVEASVECRSLGAVMAAELAPENGTVGTLPKRRRWRRSRTAGTRPGSRTPTPCTGRARK